MVKKKVFKCEIEQYLQDGWTKEMPQEKRDKQSKALKVYFKKFETSSCSHNVTEETKKLISENTKKGMQKAKENGKQIGHITGTTAPNKGKRYITDGKISKVWPNDKEIPEGWRAGQTQNKRTDPYICVHNETERKRISPNDLDKYLNDGWIRGH